MKAKDFSNKMERAIDSAVENMQTRKVSLSIFTRLMLSIRKRTRLGFGADYWGGKRKKLKKLSPRYVKQRKRYGVNSSKASPSRSNLTRTGKMLDAFRVYFIASGKFALGLKIETMVDLMKRSQGITKMVERTYQKEVS